MSHSYEDEARRRPKGKDLRPLARLSPYLARYKGRAVLALVALLAAAAATLAVPIAVRRVIDNGFTAANATLVNQYFAVMLLVVAVLALGSAIRFYYVMWLGERVVGKTPALSIPPRHALRVGSIPGGGAAAVWRSGAAHG